MEMDTYGKHLIQSLYYDTPNYEFIRHSMEKPVYKEKFRVRCYGTPTEDTPVFLELKKKIQHVVYKRRIETSYTSFRRWASGGEFPIDMKQEQISRELCWIFKQYPTIQPKVLISYQRLSYFGKEDPSFRVTFDQEISYQNDNLSFIEIKNRNLVAPEIGVLMEVKALGAYPLWFVSLLNRHQLQKNSFSKYAQTYQRYLSCEGE